MCGLRSVQFFLQTRLDFCDRKGGLDDGIGIERHALYPLLDEELCESGMVGGRLPADADVFLAPRTDLDDITDKFFDRGVVLSGHAIDDAGIAVQSESELGEVVTSNGHPVENIEEFIGEYRIGGYLAHHDDLRRVFFLRGR